MPSSLRTKLLVVVVLVVVWCSGPTIRRRRRWRNIEQFMGKWESGCVRVCVCLGN
ncbi:hypothetical protein ASPFODRAFT_40910 [Aspergillus luchuensis CBS 106.47]|uniref:Uncharacterized protein n=1 Tax=Aspergillus luchuensis (strain CBS 106.47) TaxID=1137211 RepID=A0A1M3TVD2_ASPLC|nr:hypothetical protein ASPFODRAFT_40910 [Aspergillus luchuensis CBS 106.47]